MKDFSSKQSTSQTTPATSFGSRKRQDRSHTDEVTGAAASGPAHRESVQKERKTKKDGTSFSSESATGTSTATRKASVTTKTVPVPKNTKSLDTTTSIKSRGHPSSPSGAVSKKERGRKDEIIIMRADDKRGHSDKGNESKLLTLTNKQGMIECFLKLLNTYVYHTLVFNSLHSETEKNTKYYEMICLLHDPAVVTKIDRYFEKCKLIKDNNGYLSLLWIFGM